MNVNSKNKVAAQDLKTYAEIDGLEVIEELLLFKGESICGGREVRRVSSKLLDDMALVTYGLKSNATNKLYVGMALDKYYQRAGLVHKSGTIIVPVEIFDRVKEINDQYRQPPTK